MKASSLSLIFCVLIASCGQDQKTERVSAKAARVGLENEQNDGPEVDAELKATALTADEEAELFSQYAAKKVKSNSAVSGPLDNGNGSAGDGNGSADDGKTTGGQSPGEKIIAAALAYKGRHYQFSAPRNQTDTFDCSSLVWRAIMEAGIGNIKKGPAQKQREQLAKMANVVTVSKDSMQPGDILFLNWGRLAAGQADHVAFYFGNNKILDATTTLGVQVHNSAARYKDDRVLQVLRIVGPL